MSVVHVRTLEAATRRESSKLSEHFWELEMVKQQQQKTKQAQYIVWQALVIAVAASASVIGCGTAPSALDAATWKMPPAQLQATLRDACTRAEEPEVGACIGLVQLYERSTFPDTEGLQAVLTRACDLGYAPSCVDLARQTATGDDIAKDRAAVERAIASCDQGYAPACLAAGSMQSWFSEETTKGLPDAETLYKKGCAQGDSIACLQNGGDMSTPEGLAQTIEGYGEACKMGNKSACMQQIQLSVHSKASLATLKANAALLEPLCAEGNASACATQLVTAYRIASPEAPDAAAISALRDRLCSLDRYECANIADQFGGYLYAVTEWPFDAPSDAHPYAVESVDPALALSTTKLLCDTYDTKNSGYYCYRYANLLEGADKTPVLERACTNGDNDACTTLADLTTDLARKESFLNIACGRGNQTACISLADMTTDLTRKDELYALACEAGEGVACQDRVRLVLGMPTRNSNATETSILAPIPRPSEDTQTKALELIYTTCNYSEWACTDIIADIVNSLNNSTEDPRAFAPLLFPELLLKLRQICSTSDAHACTTLANHFERAASPNTFSDASLCYQNQLCANGYDCNAFILAAQHAPAPSTYPTADILRTIDKSCADGNSLLACMTAARVYTSGTPSLRNPQRAQEIFDGLCEKASDDSDDRAPCAAMFAFVDAQKPAAAKPAAAPAAPTKPAAPAAPAAPDAFSVACTEGSDAACFAAGLRALKLPPKTFDALISQRLAMFDSTQRLTRPNPASLPFLGIEDTSGADTSALVAAVFSTCENTSDESCVVNAIQSNCEQNGNTTACQETAIRTADADNPDHAAARTLLTKTCSAAKPNLCTFAGLHTLLELPGAKADIAAAIPMLKTSCDAKAHASACTLFGLASLSGSGTTKDPAAAASALTTACDHHKEPLACFLLADLHTKGIGATKDPEAAKRLNAQACAAGFALACPAAPAKAATK